MAGIARVRRHRGGGAVPEHTYEGDVLARLFDPAPVVGATADETLNPEHPFDESGLDTPIPPIPPTRWPKQLRQHARRHLPAVVAAVVLILAGAATLLAPVRGTACPTTLVALSAKSVAGPGGVAPQQAKGQVTVDNQAITSATGQVSDAQSAVDAAEAAQTAAGKLQEKADAAQSAADEASTAQDPFASDSAQWDVDNAESTLEWAQSDLESSESMLATDKAEGWDTTYDKQAVADAKAAVKDAKAALAKANAALAAEQSAADSAASDAQSRQKTADQLATKAGSAQEKADADLATAEAALTNAQATLSSAEATQSAHRQTAATAAALWSHQHQIDLFATSAANTTIADCRGAATKNAGVGAGLLIAAVLLLLVDGFTGWRRSTVDAGDADTVDADADTVDADAQYVDV